MNQTTTFLLSTFSGTPWLALAAIGVGVVVGLMENIMAPIERTMKERSRLACLYGAGWGAAVGVLTILIFGHASSTQLDAVSFFGGVGLWAILSAVSSLGSLKAIGRAFRRSRRFA